MKRFIFGITLITLVGTLYGCGDTNTNNKMRDAADVISEASGNENYTVKVVEEEDADKPNILGFSIEECKSYIENIRIYQVMDEYVSDSKYSGTKSTKIPVKIDRVSMENPLLDAIEFKVLDEDGIEYTVFNNDAVGNCGIYMEKNLGDISIFEVLSDNLGDNYSLIIRYKDEYNKTGEDISTKLSLQPVDKNWSNEVEWLTSNKKVAEGKLYKISDSEYISWAVTIDKRWEYLAGEQAFQYYEITLKTCGCGQSFESKRLSDDIDVSLVNKQTGRDADVEPYESLGGNIENADDNTFYYQITDNNDLIIIDVYMKSDEMHNYDQIEVVGNKLSDFLFEHQLNINYDGIKGLTLDIN